MLKAIHIIYGRRVLNSIINLMRLEIEIRAPDVVAPDACGDLPVLS